MKKRAMKKWIPKGMYCHRNGTKNQTNCKWRKYITTVKRDSSSCRDIVYKCEYMNFIDWEQKSLLWDACKECGIKDY